MVFFKVINLLPTTPFYVLYLPKDTKYTQILAQIH
jgi:hypothetical protein